MVASCPISVGRDFGKARDGARWHPVEIPVRRRDRSHWKDRKTPARSLSGVVCAVVSVYPPYPPHTHRTTLQPTYFIIASHLHPLHLRLIAARFLDEGLPTHRIYFHTRHQGGSGWFTGGDYKPTFDLQDARRPTDLLDTTDPDDWHCTDLHYTHFHAAVLGRLAAWICSRERQKRSARSGACSK